MTISNELMYAILSMDSYNRGYNAGIANLGGLGSKIGTASLVTDSEAVPSTKDIAQAAGFYASAYSYKDETVISYRGTDSNWELFATDFPLAGSNDFDESEVHLASKFFRSVDAQTSGAITTTGHSLGGALAGFAGRLYGSNVFAVDPIDFFPALLNLKLLLDRYQEIKGTENASNHITFLPQMGGVPTVAFAEEQLEEMGIPLTAIPNINSQLSNYMAFHLSGSIAGIAREAATPSTALTLPGLPNIGLTVGPIDAHSASLNVILKFAEQEIAAGNSGFLNFIPVADPVLNALFENSIAQALDIPAKGSQGESTSVGKMRDMIAYSALDEGTLVFGNTGIRSLFDDASELGLAVSGGEFYPANAEFVKLLSNAIVEFSGLQAMRKTVSDLTTSGLDNLNAFNAARGILQMGSTHQNIMRIDLTDFTWDDGAGNAVSIVGRNELFDDVLTDANVSGIKSLESLTSLLSALPGVQKSWGNFDQSVFDTIYARTDSSAATKDVELFTYTEAGRASQPDGVGLYVSFATNENITGSTGNDLIIINTINTTGHIDAGAGNDVVILGENAGAGGGSIKLGAGNDYFLGNNAANTIVSYAGDWSLQPTDYWPTPVLSGDGDDTYSGSAPTGSSFNFKSWYKAWKADPASVVTDMVSYKQSDLAYYNPGLQGYSEAPNVNTLGVSLNSLSKSEGQSHAVTVQVSDKLTGISAGTDVLEKIHVLQLSRNPDSFSITQDMLDIELAVDMFDSRRLQSEVDAYNATLLPGQEPLPEWKESDFTTNLDVADYSAVSTGLLYYGGRTAVRTGGDFLEGSLIRMDTTEEYKLATNSLASEHKLKVEGADKVILTKGNDTFIGAKAGTIIDLGGGADKVYLTPNVQILNFGADDRIAIIGQKAVYGGHRNSESDSPWAEGAYGTRYAINPGGELVIANQWLGNGKQYMYIADWNQKAKPVKETIGSGDFEVGPGDIALAEFSFRSSVMRDLIKGVNPPKGDGESMLSLWSLFRFEVRTLLGSEFYSDDADPLILDLDGDGFGLEWRNGDSPNFDIDVDLYAEQVATLDKDDGYLARDINGDGLINDASELFGRGSILGFSVLAELDGNDDGAVNSADNGLADFDGNGLVDANDTFESLLIWQDANRDMISQANELKSVAELDIVSFTIPENDGVIDEDGNGEPDILETINGSHIVGVSDFLRGDGSTGQVGEAFLSVDHSDTVYVGPEIVIADAVADLPDLKGFGTLTSFKQSLSYMSDPDDPIEQQRVADAAAEVEALLGHFSHPNILVLKDAFRPLAQIWGNTAPVKNVEGDIVTGLETRADVQVMRERYPDSIVDGELSASGSLGDVVDYVWGGGEETSTDSVTGEVSKSIYVEFASGARITYEYLDAQSASPIFDDWQQLYSALFGDGLVDVGELSSVNQIGSWGGELSGANGAIRWDLTPMQTGEGSYWRGAYDGILLEDGGKPAPWSISAEGEAGGPTYLSFNEGIHGVGILSGNDLAFFERYTGEPLDVFEQKPTDQALGVEVVEEAIDRIEETYRSISVRIAMQAGPLSHHFDGLEYNADNNKFYATDPDRQMGSVYESLINESADYMESAVWLEEWRDFLGYVIADYDRGGESLLPINNPFLFQSLVDGFEAASTSLSIAEIATAVGLPGDVVIDGEGLLLGTKGEDFFYMNGDDERAEGGIGLDIYVVGEEVGNDVIYDFEPVLRNGSPDHLRFSHHQSSDLDFSRSGEDLIITVSATGEQITVIGQFHGIWPGPTIGNAWDEYGVSEIMFAGGESWTINDMVRAVSHEDANSADLYGTNATDYLDGGAGNERLVGGGEYDIYYFELGDGNDTIFDYEVNPFRTFADSIYFGDDLDLTDIVFQRDGGSSNLEISYGDQGDTILVENQFNKLHTGVFGSYFTHAIEYLVFGNGNGITADNIMSRLLSQNSTSGDDVIFGFDRADVINAGAGDDWMQGGNGSDTYLFGHGYGNDTILERMTNILSGKTDTLQFNSDVAFSDVEFLRPLDSSDLIILLDDGSQLNILNQFDAVFAGAFGILSFDQIEYFEFENTSGVTDTYSSFDIQEIILSNTSTDGDDVVVGFYTDDILDGGLGDDFLVGGDGNDIYRYNIGDGNDVIHEQNVSISIGGQDAIQFGPGISFGDISLSRGEGESHNDLILTINQTGETLTIQNQFAYGTINYRPDRIEEFRFGDGQVYSATDIETAYLNAVGTQDNDVISGFNSSDLLDGGAGDDYLAGDAGDDVYLFGYGYGHDTIREEIGYITYSDFDVVRFGAGITLSDVEFTLGDTSVDLKATLISTGDTLTILGQNEVESILEFTWHDIEQFEFSDGTIIAKNDLLPTLVASQTTEFDDTIYGFSTGDIIDGLGGDDHLIGGGGADTYLFGYGSGNDLVTDVSGVGSTEIDRVQFGAGISQSEVAFSSSGGDLAITLTSSGEVLTLERYLEGSSVNHIEELVFDDGTVLSRSDVQKILVDGQSTSGDDVIVGTGGDDIIFGGKGNDELQGKGGDDTYLFRAGDGQDIIREDGFLTFDSISIEGIDSADVVFSRETPESNNLVIQFAGSTDQITVLDGLDGDKFDQVEQVEFADGTVISIEEIRESILARNSTDGNDYLAGFGSAGSDAIVDVLVGGLKDDYLTGLDGDDIYRFAKGDGRDTIRESGFRSDDVLEISGYLASELKFSRSFPGSEDLVIEFINSDDRITIINTLAGDQWDQVELVKLDDGIEFSIEDIRLLILQDINDGLNPAVTGTELSDDLSAGNGVQLISGGGGDDQYFYAQGDGNLVIEDNSFATADTLHISGYSPNDVSLATNPHLNRDLIISFNGTDATIRIIDAINNGNFNSVDTITFDDGTIWDNTTLTAADNAPGVYIEGSNFGDTFTSTSQNEYFAGRRGDDIYQFDAGFGHDEIADSFVRIELRGISASDVTLERPSSGGDDLLIRVASTGDSLLVQGVLAESGSNASKIVFDDGTIWDASIFGPDMIANRSTDGDDYVVGYRGSGDVLSGGKGNDFLRGDRGEDVYLFSRGDGKDTISDGGLTEVDRLIISGYEAQEVIFSRLTPDSEDEAHLLIRFVGTTDEIIVRNTLSGLGSIEEITLDDGTIWLNTQISEFLDNSSLVANHDTGLVANQNEGLAIGSGDLLINDLADANSVLRVVSVYGSINGEVSLAEDGSITFTPATDYEGPAAFSYVVMDEDGVADSANVSLTVVAPSKELPNNAVLISVADILGSNNGAPEFVSVDGVTGGTAEIDVSGDIIFIPNSDYSGTASFTYVISGGDQAIEGEYTFEFGDAVTPPELVTPIDDFTAPEDSEFVYQVDPASFSSAESDTLNYLAKLSDGSSLPEWLQFDPVNLTFSGQPPENFFGDLEIELTAANAQFEVSDTLLIKITPVNDAPELDAGFNQQNINEDEAFSFSIPVDAFKDVDGDQLTIIASLADGSPIPAWLSFDGTTFSGVPPQDFNDVIDIKLTASDGDLDVQHDFNLRVLGVNDAPEVAQAIEDQSGNEDTPFSFELPTGIFNDRDGTFLALVANLTDGSPLPTWLTFDSGTFSGTPPLNFNGVLNVAVIASDGLASVSDSFLINIQSVNDVPIVANVLTDQSAAEDNFISFTLPAEAFDDIDGDSLTLTAQLSDGTNLPSWLVFNGSSFTGTSPLNFNGSLNVRVIASDGELETSDTFTLEITPINDAPIVANQLADQTILEEGTLQFSIPANTFQDVDGNSLELSVSMAGGAELPDWLSFDGSNITGTAPTNFNGQIVLKVTASDGELEASSNFSLIVQSVNDAPVVVGIINDQSTHEDTAFTFSIPAELFDDPDEENLTLSARLSDGGDLPVWMVFDGTSFSGTPPQDFNGNLEVVITADDGSETVSTGFTFTIVPQNDAPITSGTMEDQVEDEDQAMTFTVPSSLFSDVDNDSLVQTARLASGAVLPVWLAFDGSTFAGTPPQNFNGSLAVVIEANDGEYSTQFKFNLVIAPVNDAPTPDVQIVDQTIVEDQIFAFSIPAAAFSDVDGDNLTVTAELTNGDVLPDWLSFDGSTFEGTPPQDFNTENNTPINITVTASDGEEEASQQFNLVISGVNDAVTVFNPVSDQICGEDQTFSFTLPNDVFADADGDALTVSASLDDGSALPSWLAFDGTIFQGMPPQDFNGTINVRLTAADGSSEAFDDFVLTITPDNDAPIAHDDSGFQLDENTSLTISAADLLANDIDVDGDSLSIISVQTNGNATVTLDSNGDVIYAPETGFVGNDSFNYTISDGVATSQSVVSVSVEESEDYYEDWDVGGEGTDIIIGDTFSGNMIYGAGGNDLLIGGRRADQIDGGTGNDLIFGGVGKDTLNGNDGDDIVLGGRGRDMIFGGAGDDLLLGGTQADQVFGGIGNDIIYGGSGKDTLYGDDGDDLVIGGSGKDTIHGGAGDDILFGGTGSDTFIYGDGDGHDVIMDYHTGSRRSSRADNISINIDGIENFEDLMTLASQSNGNVVFDFGDGDALVLRHTRLAALDQDAFTFF